jgi:hypothetical protein
LDACFRKAEVLDLALLNQFFHRAGDIFNRHVWIDAVLIEQIDNIGPESFQRIVGDLFDVLGPTIESNLLTFGTKFETEFSGYHHLPTERGESFAYKFFVRERAVHFGGVEECDASFHR